MVEGAIVALVTPFRNGQVDFDAIKKLVEFQIANGTDGIVPCGTTGESATLSYEEHNLVIEAVIEATKKRVPVIAGTGSNSTTEAIELTKHAEKAGADYALLITPYYNRPTQEGLYRHFKEVAKATNLPLILYNVPTRTGVNMSPETVARLAEIDNIIGLKDASGNLTQTAETIHLTKGKIKIFCGDDGLFLPMLSIGAVGGICVVNNIAPKLTSELWDSWKQGDRKKAEAIYYKLHILNRVLYLETNPIPVKWAVHRLGLITDEIRLPLNVLSEKFRPQVESAMKEVGLID